VGVEPCRATSPAQSGHRRGCATFQGQHVFGPLRPVFAIKLDHDPPHPGPFKAVRFHISDCQNWPPRVSTRRVRDRRSREANPQPIPFKADSKGFVRAH